MSASHKEALAIGRDEGRAVRRYLEALEANKPKRGRKRTADSIKKRLVAIEAELAEAEPLGRLHLLQEKENLDAQIAAVAAKKDLAELEAAFVQAAVGYSERKGISYDVWRRMGVKPAVLAKAGIYR